MLIAALTAAIALAYLDAAREALGTGRWYHGFRDAYISLIYLMMSFVKVQPYFDPAMLRVLV